VREYQLRYRVIFRVAGAKGYDYIPPSDVILTRDITFNDQILSLENQEQMLYRDMRSDMVQQIVRRMAAAKPPAAQPDE
jgi:LPS-assembly lipoprotein